MRGLTTVGGANLCRTQFLRTTVTLESFPPNINLAQANSQVK